MGGTGVRLRLVQASENLGINMQMASKHVSHHESENGEAHFLFGVALAQEEDYQRLITEVDRLAAESHVELSESLASDDTDARMLARYLTDQQTGNSQQIERDMDWALE